MGDLSSSFFDPIRCPVETVPSRALIESGIDVERLLPLAIREGNRKKPIYEMHKWWARRLGVNFRAFLLAATADANLSEESYWNLFYSRHDLSQLLVLDPFMGGGTSVVEARKLGLRVMGNDIDPVAWFVTKKETDCWNEESYRDALKRIEEKTANSLRGYYRTKTDRSAPADVVYFFWVDLIPCPKCGVEFEAHINHLIYDDQSSRVKAHRLAFCGSCHELRRLTKRQRKFICRKCATETDCLKGPLQNGRFTCPHCGAAGNLKDLLEKVLPLKKRLFALEYVDPFTGEQRFKTADSYDLAVYAKAARKLQGLRRELPIPEDEIPTENRLDARPIVFGHKHYYEMFNERQLLSLGIILKEILRVTDKNTREYLLLAFSDSLASNNMLASYAFGYRKLTPLFGIHSYRRVTRPVEGNAWGASRGRGSFISCARKVLKGKRYAEEPWEYDYSKAKPTRVLVGGSSQRASENGGTECRANQTGRVLLQNSDARSLDWLEDRTVDIVLTDPPYYDNISYSELSDFYYVWIRDHVDWPTKNKRKHTPMQRSLVVDSRNSEHHNGFIEGLTSAFKECRRVLKPNGLLVFTYHHKRSKAWAAMAQSLSSAGFQATNVFPMLSEGKSGFHSSKGSLKWDIVFSCRPTSERKLPLFSLSNAKKWQNSKSDYWVSRLSSAGYDLSEADQESLRFGLMTAYMTSKSISTTGIAAAFDKLSFAALENRGTGSDECARTRKKRQGPRN
jgi:adenine-specific DNA methylase